jgi:hypothetical protein
MTLIERWTIKVCPSCGLHGAHNGFSECLRKGLDVERIEVEVVPASQLEGAVEALSACVFVLENRANATRDKGIWERLAAEALDKARAVLPKETR